jgi:hypothetical protein
VISHRSYDGIRLGVTMVVVMRALRVANGSPALLMRNLKAVTVDAGGLTVVWLLNAGGNRVVSLNCSLLTLTLGSLRPSTTSASTLLARVRDFVVVNSGWTFHYIGIDLKELFLLKLPPSFDVLFCFRFW